MQTCTTTVRWERIKPFFNTRSKNPDTPTVKEKNKILIYMEIIDEKKKKKQKKSASHK